MPPSLALFIWFILVLLLLRFDPARDPESSPALWVPTIWILIVASRLPSQWLGGQVETAAAAFEEGNSLDRAIWSTLLLMAIGILVSRSFQWGDFLSRNLALMTYLSFTLLSILWSDFAFVSLKRWFRDLGSYLMILVVLSDPRPWEAVRILLRNLCYLLIPLSIILIKYFVSIGRLYDQWSGDTLFVGVTTSKNMLGALCLMSGIFFWWDTLTLWRDRKEPRTRRILLVNLTFIAMTLWLLHLAHSATSAVCLVIGCIVIAAAQSTAGKRHSAFLKSVIPASFCLYIVLGFGFGLNAAFSEMLGRDPTLTDRTNIWKVLLSMHTDPLFGTGYESFWLGSRLDLVSQRVGETVSEAHDGYLEVYLNLGTIGLLLLTVFLIVAYRNIWKRELARSTFMSLTLGLWTVAIVYNVTEAAFKHGLMWLALMMGAIVLPEPDSDQALDLALQDPPDTSEQSLDVNTQPAGYW